MWKSKYKGQTPKVKPKLISPNFENVYFKHMSWKCPNWPSYNVLSPNTQCIIKFTKCVCLTQSNILHCMDTIVDFPLLLSSFSSKKKCYHHFFHYTRCEQLFFYCNLNVDKLHYTYKILYLQFIKKKKSRQLFLRAK